MKLEVLTVAALVIVIVGAAPVLAQSPDFSGMWTLDQDASDFTPPAFSGGRGGADVGRLFITHAANGTVLIGAETNGRKAWSYTPGHELSIPVGRDTTMMAASRWQGRATRGGGPSGRHADARGHVAQPGREHAHDRGDDDDAGRPDPQHPRLHKGSTRRPVPDLGDAVQGIPAARRAEVASSVVADTRPSSAQECGPTKGTRARRGA